MEINGLIPAAGFAKRLGRLPCSKEILPIGYFMDSRGFQVKVNADYLLEYFAIAGIKKVCFVIRKGKEDIIRYYDEQSTKNLTIKYRYAEHPYGAAFTAFSGVKQNMESYYAFGFPDIIFSPENTYTLLIEKIKNSRANIVLGLFPVQQAEKFDTAAFDSSERITDIRIKKTAPGLQWAWINAIWDPVFNTFFKRYIAGELKNIKNNKGLPDYHMGHVFQKALTHGLTIDYVKFENGTCLDTGTPENLVEIMSHNWLDKAP